jgi:YggT family protein
MLNPFIDLIASLIHLYKLCVLAWIIITTLISFKIINAYQPAVRKIMYALTRLVEPVLKPIQKRLPDLGGIDISPILLWLLLDFAVNALYRYFYNL